MLVCVQDDAQSEKVRAFFDNKGLGQEQCRITEFRQNKDIESVVREANGDFVALIEQEHLSSLATLWSWWTKHRERADHDTIYNLSSAKRMSIKSWLHSAAFNLFSPAPHHDYSNLIQILSKDRAVQLLKGKSLGKTSADTKVRIAIEQKLGKGEAQDVKLDLQKQTSSQRGFFGSLITSVGFGLGLFRRQYIAEPLADWKASRTSILSEADHSTGRLIFLALSVLALIIMPTLSFSYGILWDEPDHVDYATDILSYFVTLGADQTVFDETKGIYFAMKHYGISFDTFTIFIYKTISPFGLYETRHLLNAICGAVGVIYAGLIARQLGSWRAGIFAFIILLISPYFFAHSMNNHKDIPFAVGYVMSIYYLVLYMKQLPRPRISTIVFLSLSIAFANSIRIGGLIIMGFVGLFTGIYWLYHAYRHKVKAALALIPRFAFYVVLIGLVSFFVGILFWPYGLQNPLKNPFEALTVFSNFRLLTIYEIFEGQRFYMNEVPWSYTPKWILFTSPLVGILGAVLFLGMLVLPGKKYSRALSLAMLFVIIFPLSYAIYKDSTLYNGWRHFLFIYPPLVTLAALGWDWLVDRFDAKAIRIGVFAVLVALTSTTVVWSFQNHPNLFAYFNPLIGGYDGAYGEFESDSYGNVGRQGIEWLIENEGIGDSVVSIGVNLTPKTMTYYSQKVSDSIRLSWLREHERYAKNWDYALLSTRTYSPTELKSGAFPPKGTIHVIEVENSPLLAIVKKENNYAYEGYRRSNTKNYQGAIPFFEKAVEYDPNNEEVRRMLALCYLNMGKNKEAGTELEKCLEINPNSYMALTLMSNYNLRTQNYKGALENLVAATDNKVNHTSAYLQMAAIYDATDDYYLGTPKIYAQMGNALVEQNKLDDAIKYLNIGRNQDKEYLDLYEPLALAYARKGQFDMMNKINRAYKRMTGRNTATFEEVERLREEQGQGDS